MPVGGLDTHEVEIIEILATGTMFFLKVFCLHAYIFFINVLFIFFRLKKAIQEKKLLFQILTNIIMYVYQSYLILQTGNEIRNSNTNTNRERMSLARIDFNSIEKNDIEMRYFFILLAKCVQISLENV